MEVLTATWALPHIGNGVAAGDRKKIVEGSPVLAVFSTEGDETADWIATGRALSRVLLKLIASGATASFLNQHIEVDALRPRLAELTGIAGMPHSCCDLAMARLYPQR